MRYQVQFYGQIGDIKLWYTFHKGYYYLKKRAVTRAYLEYHRCEKDFPVIRGVRVIDRKKDKPILHLTYPQGSATIDS